MLLMILAIVSKALRNTFAVLVKEFEASEAKAWSSIKVGNLKQCVLHLVHAS